MEFISPINSFQFSNKHKYIIINIVAIIFYIILNYHYYHQYYQKNINIRLLNELNGESPFSIIEKNENHKNNNIKKSEFITYNNNFYHITREKYLYEKQKQLLFQSLSNNLFIGTWKNISSNFDLGESEIFFEKAIERKSRIEALAITIKNKQGKYIDSWTNSISFSKYNSLERKINLIENTFDIRGIYISDFEKGEIFESKFKKEKCISIINITFPLIFVNINATTLNGQNVYLGKIGIIDSSNFTMKLESNCGLKFSINAKKIKMEEGIKIKQGKLKLYFFLCLFSTILYCTGIILLYCGLKNNEGYISCINLEIFSFNSIWNFYCCVSNVYIAFNTDFNFFIIFCGIGLLSLLKFFAFDTIIYTIYWRFKERTIINTCQLIKIKTRFYFLICISFLLCFFWMTDFFINSYCIITMSLLLWLPQIIYNIISNNRCGYPFIFILACSLDRVVYPFYFRSYEDNYFELKPNFFIFMILLLIIIFSTIILLIQTFAGPRFMLPYRYQDIKNEFYKNYDEIKNLFKDINEECVICLMPIFPEEKYEMIEMKENNYIVNLENNDNENNNKEQIIDSVLLNTNEDARINDSNKLLIKESDEKNEKIKMNHQLKNKEKKCVRSIIEFIKDFFRYNFFSFYKSSSNINNKPFILTPCKHIFHSYCLDKWLEQKKECPNCRKSLVDYFD